MKEIDEIREALGSGDSAKIFNGWDIAISKLLSAIDERDARNFDLEREVDDLTQKLGEKDGRIKYLKRCKDGYRGKATRLEGALRKAIEWLVEIAGNCPLDQFDWHNPERDNCEACGENIERECWESYFKALAPDEGKKEAE